MIKEVMRKEIENIKYNKNRKNDAERITQITAEGVQRSYSEVIKGKKKERIIIIKPKMRQENEATKKKKIKKVNIKTWILGIKKLRKRGKRTVIISCETGKEICV